MSGWKDWQIGEVVTEGDFQSLVQDQVVQRYADATARDTTLGTAVAEGMVAYLDNSNVVQVYNGTAWVPIGEGDITAVNAGTALTGGGTSGDVTLNVDLSAITIPTSQISDLTATAAELNILDGVTATASELNILDGATVTAAALNTIDDGTAGYTALSNGTAGISYQPVSHNYIINGAFDVWQRGTSFSNPGVFVYTSDRWQAIVNGSPTHTVTKETFTPGVAPVSGQEAESFLRLNVTGVSGSTVIAMGTRLEDVRTLAGQTATLSFYAKADTARTWSSNIIQNFGSGGSAEVTTVASSSLSVTTSWQRFTLTVLIPSISGKTIGAGSYLYVVIYGPANVTQTLDIWGVQLEAGSVATPFKRHAPSLQGELAACQRYYQKHNFASTEDGLVYGAGYTGENANFIFPLVVEMRTSPTAAFVGTLSVIQPGYGTKTFASVSSIIGGKKTGRFEGITVDPASSLTIGLPLNASAGTLTLSAEL